MWKEFKEFAIRGNVMDLAVAVIVGAAFGKVVTSLINDVLMPPIGLLMGHVDFSNLYVNLSDKTIASVSAAKTAGVPVVAYGLFVNTVIEFVIIAFVVFMMVRPLNRLKPAPAPAPPPPATKDCPYCCSTIPLRATRCGNCTSELKA